MTAATQQVETEVPERDEVTEKVLKGMPGGRPKARPKKAPAKPKAKAEPKAAAKAKPKAAPKPRSWESLAAARASALRGSTRKVGPVQIQRVVAAVGKPLTAERVVEATGLGSRAALARAAKGEASVTDMKPMRALAQRANDGFATGRWLACECLAIVEHLESKS
jgi:hypothetical protein